MSSNAPIMHWLATISLCLHASVSMAAHPHEIDETPELFALSLSQLLSMDVEVASLFKESELDVASSTFVISQETWRQRSARRLGDVLESSPSIVTYPTWGGAEAIAIRGFATELSVRGIANTLDGVPLNSYALATSSYDKPVINLELLERVEVIRGSGSALYGTDAFHGVVSYKNLQSERDETRFFSELGDDSYSSHSLFQSEIFGNTSVNIGLARQRQGDQTIGYKYTDPLSGESANGSRDASYEDLSGFLRISTRFNKQHESSLKLYASDFSADGYPGVGRQFFITLPTPFALEGASLAGGSDRSGQDSNFTLFELNHTYKVKDNLELSGKLYRWDSQQTWRFDNSEYPDSLTTRSNITLPCLTAPSNTNPNPIYCPHELEQGSKENRTGGFLHLKTESSDLFTKAVFGIGYDRQAIEDSFFTRTASNGQIYVDERNPYASDQRRVRYAFVQGSQTLLEEKLDFVFGLRRDLYSDVGGHNSPRLGLILDLNEHFTSKLLYGHAFRAPSALEREGTFDAIDANPDLEPETIDTYEWVNIWHGQDYQLEATLFASYWRDAITLVPNGATANNQYQNREKNRARGIELSHSQSYDNWLLSTHASYVRSENQANGLEYGAFPRWIVGHSTLYHWQAQNIDIQFFQRVMLRYRQADELREELAPASRNYYRADLSFNKQINGQDGRRYVYKLALTNLFNRDNRIPSLYNAENGIPEDKRSLMLSFNLLY